MSEPNAVAGYYRVSVARDDMKAPELYEEEIRRYCAYKNLEVAKVYSDIDYSAFRGAKPRPALEELKNQRRDYAAVVVPKLSRFGRSVKELAALFELFDSDGISLVFLDVNIDTSTSQGRLMRNLMAVFAEYESDVRGDYWRATHDWLAQHGYPNGSAPYGYGRVRHGLEIDPERAAVMADLFARHASGESMLSLVRDLNARGVPAPKGGLWRPLTLRKMLSNPAYIGLRRYRDTLVPAVWEPIVSVEVWQASQARRYSGPNPMGVNQTKRARETYLLSGLIICGVCGRRLNHRTRQDRSPGSYVCRTMVVDEPCRGGNIADHRAHAQIEKAYLSRYPERRDEWEAATVLERRALVEEAIAAIVLPPRAVGNSRGQGIPRGRHVLVEWRVDAPMSQARRQSWAQFRSERLLFPGFKSSSGTDATPTRA